MEVVAAQPDLEAVRAAIKVLDKHFDALNRHDEPALKSTLHFPHYRIAGDRVQVWMEDSSYLQDFYSRAGEGWARSEWQCRNVISASSDKVHLDGIFTRYNSENEVMGYFRTIWIVTRMDNHWAALARSSFAR